MLMPRCGKHQKRGTPGDSWVCRFLARILAGILARNLARILARILVRILAQILARILAQILARILARSLGIPGGTQKSFIRGGSTPRSNLLPFYIPFFQNRYPFGIPFIGKRHPFHIPSKEDLWINRSNRKSSCHFFHVARNKLKWNSHKLRLLDLF